MATAGSLNPCPGAPIRAFFCVIYAYFKYFFIHRIMQYMVTGDKFNVSNTYIID